MKKQFSFRIDEQNEQHTRITIFNQGGSAGQLTILTSDVDEFIRRLTGNVAINQEVGSVGAGAKVTGVKIERLG